MLWLCPRSLGCAWFGHSAALEAHVDFSPICVPVLLRDTLPFGLEEARFAIALCYSWHVCQNDSRVLSLLHLLMTSIGIALPTLDVALLCIALMTTGPEFPPLYQD